MIEQNSKENEGAEFMDISDKDNMTAAENTSKSEMFSVGIYARLSVDSNNKKNESIESQIEIAKEYINKYRNMKLYDCYTDLGRSGTDFCRDGFERMMSDVRARKINCIVVKDLSRFGRNHIETGSYIEKIFPFFGVRFIAVTDCFDSFNIANQSEAIKINLKNLVNEMYARDISIKVKSAKRAMAEQGSYVGGNPPYGYRIENINTERCLCIDEETSYIVKEIYNMFIASNNLREIKLWLYKQRIHRPKDYRNTGHVFCIEGEALREWSVSTIKGILKNPVYTGNFLSGIDDKSENKHPKIISEQIFLQVSMIFEKNEKYANKKALSEKKDCGDGLFQTVLVCGDCGAQMRRRSYAKHSKEGEQLNSYYYYCPNAERIDSQKCNRKYISEIKLNSIVNKALYGQLLLAGIRQKDIAREVDCQRDCLYKVINTRTKQYAGKMNSIKKYASEQYLKYREGIISREVFDRLMAENNERRILIEREAEKLDASLKKIDRETECAKKYLRSLFKCCDKTMAKPELVEIFISKIQLFADKRLKIVFAFNRPYIDSASISEKGE